MPGAIDDIASWQLGRDVTNVVRGTRWTAATQPIATTTAAAATEHVCPTRRVRARGRRPAQAAQAGKKIVLDDNGLPSRR